MDYRTRQKQFAAALGQKKLRAFLITHLPNVRYLCGFTGSNGVLAVECAGQGKVKFAFFTDGRYTLQAREQVQGASITIGKKSSLVDAADWLARHSGRSAIQCGFEAQYVSVASLQTLKRAIPAHMKLKPYIQSVERLRMVKDVTELAQIRAAVLLASEVFQVVLPDVKPGKAESALAAEIEYLCRRMGAEGMSFDTLVSSGKRSALPHGVASGHPLPEKGFVIMDFGVKLGGYCSDMTRTIHLGRVNPRSKRIYEAVKASQEAGIKAVKPGALASEVDYACRKSLEKAGLARYFTHSTGHGVGLEIHEIPGLRAAPKTKKKGGNAAGKGRMKRLAGLADPERLEPGMVVTVEPGVYIPGFGGVRIEDMVVVTDTGCEVLTPTTKELLVL